MMRLALIFVVACGSSARPASQPPAATTPVTSAPPEPGCPARGEIQTAIGTPCPTEGQSCGSKEAAAATGFSNVLLCKGGHWQNLEVPPPPPH
jgi:hypothetical protein